MSEPQTPVSPEPQPQAPIASAYAPAVAGPKQALSLTSFILGLAGVVFSWIPVLGFLVPLGAVILGFIGKKKEEAAPKWMSLTGIITGFVGIGLSLIVGLIWIVGIILNVILINNVNSIYENLPDYY